MRSKQAILKGMSLVLKNGFEVCFVIWASKNLRKSKS